LSYKARGGSGYRQNHKPSKGSLSFSSKRSNKSSYPFKIKSVKPFDFRKLTLGSTFDSKEILNYIMTLNAPEQINRGKMTPEEWADTYLSPTKHYVLMDVSPKAMFLPVPPGLPENVDKYSKSVSEYPPIVVDRNSRIEARIGGTFLDRVGGLQPYTVVDGKHRVSAGLLRGDKKMKAFVPVESVDEVLRNSHVVEVDDYALKYIEEKGYRVVEKLGAGVYKVFDSKRNSSRVIDEGVLNVVKRNRGEKWVFKSD